MLREIKYVSQHKEEGFRRWFADDFFDLIIWYNAEKAVTGFQLCYDKNGKERSLTWLEKTGFSHNKIDDGEVTGQVKMSPILVADGLFDKTGIARRFKENSLPLGNELAGFIYKKLLEADVK